MPWRQGQLEVPKLRPRLKSIVNVSGPEPPSAGPSLIRLHGPQLHELDLAQAASQGDQETNVDGVTFTKSHSRILSRPT